MSPEPHEPQPQDPIRSRHTPNVHGKEGSHEPRKFIEEMVYHWDDGTISDG